MDVKFEALEEKEQQVLRFVVAIVYEPASSSCWRACRCT